ncbi:MAG TPA: metallophosphoesterase N-terminal domain-containing protein, partial [Bacteroidales bacterium]|nr:metallophosphoesterase N-terminal domain-containing protein [Bacteroidales bacterium]
MNALRILILSLLVLEVGVLQAQTKASGVVFHDLNNNSIREPKEPGIANVAVSNGSDVVLTDKNGRYELPVDNEAIIFVIRPSGYNYPVNELNLPQFWYNHKPLGSPPLEFKGLPPTGPLPKSVDFGLITGNKSDNFSIIVFADPQVSNEAEISYYEKAFIGELKGKQMHSFGITLGDLVARRLDLLEPLNRATAQIGIPWFHVVGNHDINYDATTPQHNDETFERNYGPATYAFNHGKVHFIVLNNVIFPNPYPGHYYVGGFSEKQLRFVENSLKHVPEHYLVVLFMHIPLYDDVKFGETFVDQHREELFELLHNRPYTFSMSGHAHALHHHFFDATEGWHGKNPHHHYTTGAVSGDWWSGNPGPDGILESVMWDGTPKGYSIIRFSGNSYTIDYK